MSKTCIFCFPHKEAIIKDCEIAYIYRDQYPVSLGHSLIIPKRHFESLLDATPTEIKICWNLLFWQQLNLLKQDKSIKGFNVGVNIGKVAGQSIPHAHIHLIPHRLGDTKSPGGGVRGVIPSKMSY